MYASLSVNVTRLAFVSIVILHVAKIKEFVSLFVMNDSTEITSLFKVYSFITCLLYILNTTLIEEYLLHELIGVILSTNESPE